MRVNCIKCNRLMVEHENNVHICLGCEGTVQLEREYKDLGMQEQMFYDMSKEEEIEGLARGMFTFKQMTDLVYNIPAKYLMSLKTTGLEEINQFYDTDIKESDIIGYDWEFRTEDIKSASELISHDRD